eukprot:scaffold8333_cov159-Amphora_coffeaeformis.AAC.4
MDDFSFLVHLLLVALNDLSSNHPAAFILRPRNACKRAGPLSKSRQTARGCPHIKRFPNIPGLTGPSLDLDALVEKTLVATSLPSIIIRT